MTDAKNLAKYHQFVIYRIVRKYTKEENGEKLRENPE